MITGLPIPTRPGARQMLGVWYADCLAGREPAERLGPEARKVLFLSLWGLGWSDLEIAVHTMWTLAVVVRIRNYLELEPNK